MKKKTLMKSINVVEMVDEDLLSIRSYEQTKDGLASAKEMFKNLVKEHNQEEGPTYSEEDLEMMTEVQSGEGFYDDGCGYRLYLKYSRLS